VNVIDYLSKLLMLWNQRILLLNVFQINITFLLELGMLVSLHIRKYLLLFCTYFNHALVFLFSLCNLISYYSWSIVLLGQKLSHSSNILGFSTLHSSICLFITTWLIFPPPHSLNSETLLIFFLAQVLNFLLSVPQVWSHNSSSL